MKLTKLKPLENKRVDRALNYGALNPLKIEAGQLIFDLMVKREITVEVGLMAVPLTFQDFSLERANADCQKF